MKTEHKIITVLMAIIIIVGGILSSVVAELANKNRDKESIIAEQQSQITHHKNKAGQEYVQRRAAEADLKTLKAAYGDEIKDIKKSLDINSKAIRAIVRASTETTGSGTGKIDTIYVKESNGESTNRINVSDSTRWFNISGTLDRRGFIYTYQTRDSITLVPYKDGKKTFVKGISANPNTRITGLQGILVHEEKEGRPKGFGIGPSIQIGYDTQVRITPGISIQWSLIRF